MKNRTSQPPPQRSASDAGPPAGLGTDPNREIRNASLTAGVGLLLIAALAGFGAIIVVEGLWTPGNAAQTANDIMASEGLFRLGIVSLFLVVALDVVVAWGLYRVFSPVSRGISLLAAWLRIVFAGVFMVAISQLAGVLDLLGNDDYLAVFSAEQLQAQVLLRVNAFYDIWEVAGLFLFGLHLLVIGYLAYRSGYVPRLLGVLVAIAGFSYVFHSFVTVLSPGSLPDVSWLGALEALLALWLVIWGSRITLSESGHDEDPNAVARRARGTT